MPQRLLISIALLTWLGCRDPDRSRAPQPVPGHVPATVTTVTGRPGLPTNPHDPARDPARDPAAEGIERAFANEPEAPAWAAETVRQIEELVPTAVHVSCRRRQCRLAIVAATPEQLTADTIELHRESSLAGIARVIPTPPTSLPDGRLEMRIYAQFE